MTTMATAAPPDPVVVPAARGATPPTSPTRRARLAVAAAVALVAALATWAWATSTHGFHDLEEVLIAARLVLAGRDPYPLIGPGSALYDKFPLYYPMPAVLVALPLAPLSDAAARALFAGATFGAAAYGLTRERWLPLAALTSAAMLVTLLLTQWSGALVAAATVPALAWLVAVKPNVGIVVAATWTSRRQWVVGVAGALALVAIATLLQPAWWEGWLAATRRAPHVASLLLTPGGLLLLLALLRWRRPEARLLAALALVPHTPALYDALLLFLVPRTRAQAIALSLLTWVEFLAEGWVRTGDTFEAMMRVRAPMVVALVYLPCLVMVLRRPNEGAVPPWAERIAAAAARAWSGRLGRRPAAARGEAREQRGSAA
jgi:hypothetical protein